MADDCIFCKIIEGKIPSRRVYEDESIIAFHDVQPQAPVHVLVVPRKHVVSVAEVSLADSSIFQQVFVGAKKVSELLGLTLEVLE